MSHPMTITEKILAAHAGLEAVSPGDLIKVKVDLALANDITAPLAIRVFNEIGREKVFDPEKIALVADHFVPNKDIPSAQQAKMMKDFALKQKITHYYELGEGGIEHVILPEKGLVVPGDLVMGADSHTCTYGALGAVRSYLYVTNPGYYNRPDETALAFFPDGFLRTGDIATIDEAGFVRIVDRKKDIILVSGFNVYPNEIEDIVARHEGVLEVAAIGIPDDKSGEAVKIFIVKRDPNLTKGSVLAICHENLTAYKRPREVEFRSELPKTNVGKILRRALRDEELSKRKQAA